MCKLKDKLFDMCPEWLYRFYVYFLTYRSWKRRIKWFIQRRKYGFDDSEIWNLDDTFYKWLLPRLKRLRDVNTGYPCDKTYKSWCKELDKNIKRLSNVIKHLEEQCIHTNTYKKDRESFNKWFGENINNLWW